MEEANKKRIAEEKVKLKKKIERLELLRSQMKEKLEYYTETESNDCPTNEEENEIEWKNDLYKYSGLSCSKYIPGRECQFIFHSSKTDSKDGPYFIQILQEEEMAKLGVWKMPIFLDLNEILLKTPLEDTGQIRSFLLMCKHYLQCQQNRERQFRDLKAHIDTLSKCSVQANLEIYTSIQLKIHCLREIENDKFHNISLYIIYELNECQPSKMIIECNSGESLSTNETKNFNKFFRNFRHIKLKPAFETLLEEKELFELDISNDNIQYFQETEIEDSESSKTEKSQQEEDQGSMKKKRNTRKTNLQNTKKVSNLKQKKTEKTKKPAENKHLQKEKTANEDTQMKENLNKRKKRNKDKELESKTESKVVRKNKTRQVGKKSGKQTTLNFSRKVVNEDSSLQSKELKEQETKTNLKVKSYNKVKEASKFLLLNSKVSNSSTPIPGPSKQKQNLEVDFNISEIVKLTEPINDQEFEKNPSEQKTKDKKIQNTGKKPKVKSSNKTKKTFDLSNFVLKRKPSYFSKTDERDGNFSKPIPGQSKNDLGINSEIGETVESNKSILKLNKPTKTSVQKRTRISESSDSEFDQSIEEPSQSLINELDKIQENLINEKPKKKRNLPRSKKKIKKS